MLDELEVFGVSGVDTLTISAPCRVSMRISIYTCTQVCVQFYIQNSERSCAIAMPSISPSLLVYV